MSKSGRRSAAHWKASTSRKAHSSGSGDLLFIIDPRTYQANVDELRAQLEVARTRLDLARVRTHRGQELRQGGNIAASTLQERQQAFLEAQANVQAAQAALNVAELNLSFTRIEAPISGRIGRKLVTEGNLIAAGANSQALTTIAAVDPIYFYFSVDEQSFPQIQADGGVEPGPKSGRADSRQAGGFG